MIATISADIVRSTSLSTEDQVVIREELEHLFENLESTIPGFWARISRGDSIECFVPQYKYSLRVALLVKLLVKMWAGQFLCAESLRRFGVRFSIGVGDIRYASKKDDIIDGEAIYLSGRNLDMISRRDDVFSVFALSDRFPQALCSLIDSYVSLLSSLANSYSVKQSEVIYYKLRGFREKDISDILGIYQSSVNMRASSAQWNMLNLAIKDFENLNFELLCG